MKYHLPVFAALALSLMSCAILPSLEAGELDKKTVITISQPIAVEGTVLPVGRYVLKLQPSTSGQNVVSIFNANQTRLITTLLAIHASRLQPTDNSELKFYGASAGQPLALHTWFYPGDDSGFEFRQPRHAVAPETSVAGGY
jgi:hypothetical protein